MKFRFGFLSVATCFTIVSLGRPLYAQNKRLDTDVPQQLAQYNVPSASIAQITNDRIVLVRAYGKQDADTSATPRTLYNIASLTKPITAQVAMRLISQSRLSLDEAMAKYWIDPDIADDERHNLLTPRIALTHQTGFANWRSMTNGKLTFTFTPGTKYSYSGEGFEYLARFLEKKTGAGLEENAKQLVFNPLGMHDTAFTQQPWFQGRVATPADASGQWLPQRFAYRPISADMVYTTAADYAILLRAVIRNTGISKQVAAERDRVQISLKDQICPKLPASLCPDEVGSGLSWQVIRFGKTRILMHTGHDPGVYTFAYVSPTSHTGVVILTNGENGRKLIPAVLSDLDAPHAFVELLQATLLK